MANTNMNTQEVVAIMDRSGSMAGKIADSVGGFNSTLEVLREQMEDDTVINVSVKIFDNHEEMLIRSVPLADVRPLVTSQVVPRGQTALLDAMGTTLTYFMEKKLMNPDAYDCCTIYVVTDGLENCSRTYTQKRIKEMIKTAEDKYNIKVIYLAANQDAILEAGNIGINPGQAINYSESQEETQAAYRSAAAMVHRHRSGAPVEFLSAERQSSQRQSSHSYNSSPLPPPPTPLFNIGAAPQPPPLVRQRPNNQSDRSGWHINRTRN
tara:strand:+ start:766 stop:1563 length:798 start_codon:yes stop_codon:yes gene_type:complete